jgi:ABC-2 type transport system permease protein
MPPPLQGFTYVVAARYFVTALKGIFLKGIGLQLLAFEIFLLALYGAAVFFLTVKKLKKRIG